MITIQTQLSQNDYIRLSFVLLFHKMVTKILIAVAIAVLIFAIITDVSEPASFSFTQFLFPLFIFIWLSLGTYLFAKRNYTANTRLAEKIEYTLSNTSILVNGESFSTEVTWSQIEKVIKSRHWLLIYHSKLTANLIPGRNISDAQVSALKGILNNNGVMNNL